MSGARIERLTRSRHRLELSPPFEAAWDPEPRRHFDLDLVRVFTDGGAQGVGSGDAMPGFSGHERLFLGRDPLELPRHARVIDDLSFHYGRCWPLDLALWDLAGSLQGQPVWRLLGGRSDRVSLYASSGSRREPDAFRELAARTRESGFRALKIRLHESDWRRDLERVAAAREGAPDLELMVDCNQAWRTPGDESEPRSASEALGLARALEPLRLRWIEEPLHRADFEGLQRLRAEGGVPIAAGEMTREVHELRELIARGCVDVVQPDAALVGGISGLRGIASLARDHGVAFTPHTWGNGIGLLANAQLFAGCGGGPFLEFPLDPPGWTEARRDFPLAQPLLANARGELALGEAPGLGIALDEERLARTRIAFADETA